ncbi:MAG: ABC transporter substrate-binding protein, partial [Candidatus Latescibacteria bacterium]|nr:ABC transporter substrate-binding protein [Candidatus Latescibacterota bacterium]
MNKLLVVLALISTGFAWSFAEEVPGVTDSTIRVGMITDLTGPLAFVGQEASAGARLYLDQVNEQGGVYGRKIDLIVEDDGYQPPRTIAAFRKLVDQDRVFCFAGSMGSSTTTATFPFIERERIPLIAPLTFASAMHTPPKQYLFAMDPSYNIQAWIIVKYLLEVEKAQSPRLAVLYQDDDYGQDGLKGLREAAAHYNLPIVAEESYKKGAVDFSTQIFNLRKADPTHVVLWTVYREAAAVLKEARMADWHPQFIGGLPIADDKTLELAGTDAEGLLALQIIDFQSQDELMKQYRELLKKHAPDHRLSLYHAGDFWSAQALVEGLERAGRDLTREKLVEAMESFKGWDGSIGPPLSYGPNLRGGKNTSAFLVRADVANKTFVRATDWI